MAHKLPAEHPRRDLPSACGLKLQRSNPDVSPRNWTALPGDVTTLSNIASKLDALTSSDQFYRVLVLL